jgi:hypothetical protein
VVVEEEKEEEEEETGGRGGGRRRRRRGVDMRRKSLCSVLFYLLAFLFLSAFHFF